MLIVRTLMVFALVPACMPVVAHRVAVPSPTEEIVRDGSTSATLVSLRWIEGERTHLEFRFSDVVTHSVAENATGQTIIAVPGVETPDRLRGSFWFDNVGIPRIQVRQAGATAELVVDVAPGTHWNVSWEGTALRIELPDGAMQRTASGAGGTVFTGRRLNLAARDASVTQLVSLFAEVSRLSIIAPVRDDFRLTYRRINKPWDADLMELMAFMRASFDRCGPIFCLNCSPCSSSSSEVAETREPFDFDRGESTLDELAQAIADASKRSVTYVATKETAYARFRGQRWDRVLDAVSRYYGAFPEVSDNTIVLHSSEKGLRRTVHPTASIHARARLNRANDGRHIPVARAIIWGISTPRAVLEDPDGYAVISVGERFRTASVSEISMHGVLLILENGEAHQLSLE